MDILKKIDDVIYQEGFETKLTENDIEWKDAFGAECYVTKFETVQNKDGTIAWFQNNEIGKCFVRLLYQNNTTFNWRVYSNHSDWGIDCNHICWFGNKLIIIYKEKHSHYLVKIENFNVDILFIGLITHICITEENVIYIKQKDNKGILQRIYVNIYQTSVNSVPEKYIEKMPDVHLENFEEFRLD